MIWLSVPFWPFYFAGLLIFLLALVRPLTRWLGTSTTQQLRETQQAIAGPHPTH